MPFVQGAMFVSITAGVDLARDIETGFLNRLAMTPLRGEALLVGQLGGALVLGVIQAVVYLLVGARHRRDDRERRRRRARAAGPLGPDLVRVREPGRAARAAVRHRRGGAGDLPAAVRDAVSQLVEPAAQPDQGRLVSRGRDLQPGLLSARGDPQPRDHRLGRAGADRSGFGFATVLLVVSLAFSQSAMRSRLARTMSRFVNVARGVAWRSIHNTLVNPAILVPSIVFPLFFLIAFAGGLSRICRRSELPLSARATRRSSSCSCSCSRRRSAACSPGSRSPATSTPGSRAG